MMVKIFFLLPAFFCTVFCFCHRSSVVVCQNQYRITSIVLYNTVYRNGIKPYPFSVTYWTWLSRWQILRGCVRQHRVVWRWDTNSEWCHHSHQRQNTVVNIKRASVLILKNFFCLTFGNSRKKTLLYKRTNNKWRIFLLDTTLPYQIDIRTFSNSFRHLLQKGYNHFAHKVK